MPTKQKTLKKIKGLIFSRKASIISIWLIAALLLILLYFSRKYLGPLMIAGITAYIFNPLISFASKKTRSSRIIWVLLLYIILGITLFLIVRGILPMVTQE
ncbi:MAG: hypothetical protein V1843_03600, partial [bacterium]